MIQMLHKDTAGRISELVKNNLLSNNKNIKKEEEERGEVHVLVLSN